MEKEKIYKNLIGFGLAETEAKIYYSVLALEDAPVDKIARFADTNRTSTYPILERLEKMGLIGHLKKKGKTVYKAAPPAKLLDILEEKEEKIRESLPHLKSLFALQEGRPNVQFFEGVEGLKTVLNNILNETSSEVLIFSDGESFLNKIPDWSQGYVLKRANKNIHSRIIVKASEYNIETAKKIRAGQKKESRVTKIRLLPESYDIEYGGFDIYNNKVIFYSFDKQSVAVIIESKVISKLMRAAFEILWNDAEKYDRLLK
jgi:HTH-type transcriptional regulator, sugar sensing transcriptional regulator